MSFFVYILKSQKDGSYYIGQTKAVEERLRSHNRGACRFTKARRPWQLVYQEEYPTRAEAIRREREIKARKKRSYIEAIISL